MILIVKSLEPKCLTDLKDQGANDFVKLEGACKEQVERQLRTDQKTLCAYCQKSIKEVLQIEHYESQVGFPNRVLDYDNFLGVCSGKFYVNRKTGKKIDHCDHKRGSTPLTVDVKNLAHIETISYDENYQIKSNNADIQHDLDVTLNLNFDELCLVRRYVFDEEERSVRELAIEMGLEPLEAYSRAIRSVQKRNPEYSGYLLFEFNRLFKYYSNST